MPRGGGRLSAPAHTVLCSSWPPGWLLHGDLCCPVMVLGLPVVTVVRKPQGGEWDGDRFLAVWTTPGTVQMSISSRSSSLPAAHRGPGVGRGAHPPHGEVYHVLPHASPGLGHYWIVGTTSGTHTHGVRPQQPAQEGADRFAAEAGSGGQGTRDRRAGGGPRGAPWAEKTAPVVSLAYKEVLKEVLQGGVHRRTWICLLGGPSAFSL